MEPLSLGPLAVWRHSARGQARARLILIHGISEHSGRHLPTIAALNQTGVEVVRFDLRGSGLSGGRRQYVDRFDDYVQDVARVYNWVSSELEAKPLFVMGHSLGGAIALHFASEYGSLFHGLVLSAPGFIVGGTVSPLKIKVGRFLSHFVPTLRLPSGNSAPLSRDKAVMEAYEKDPLSSHFNTLRQGKEVLDAFANIPQRCARIHNPTLIVHGTSDRLILPVGSFEILRSLASKEKELHYLPGVYHEPHLDWEHDKFFALITHWIVQQIPCESLLKTA